MSNTTGGYMLARLAKVLVLGILLLFINGCDRKDVTGNGQLTTENRLLNSFNRVHINGNFQITISSASLHSASVKSDSNIIPYIASRVKNNDLFIDTPKQILLKPSTTPAINVITTKLQALSIKGGSAVRAEQINIPKFAVEVNGTSQVFLTGQASEAMIRAYGNTVVDARGLQCKTLKVIIMGSATVKVHVTDALETVISGRGKVEYSGNPSKIIQHISGKGEIIHQEPPGTNIPKTNP